MSRVRSTGNKSTEACLARLLRSSGISGWRRHYRIAGKPDFAFPRSRLAVFVDGCFWHGCKRCYAAPKNNRRFWAAKLAYNFGRDRLVTRTLRRKGWTVIRLWEHELMMRPKTALARIERRLRAPLVVRLSWGDLKKGPLRTLRRDDR
jgi:DNA mismatch endonuclease, patch repair protein